MFLVMAERVVTTLSSAKITELMKLVNRNCAANTCGCLLVVDITGRFSKNAKGYIQIKVKTPRSSTDTTNPNSKVQLHQLIAWSHPDATRRETFRAAIKNGSGEVSHLCSNKSCANPNHLTIEDSYINKTRWGCPAVIKINEQLYPCCKHVPLCIATAEKIETAPTYTVGASRYPLLLYSFPII